MTSPSPLIPFSHFYSDPMLLASFSSSPPFPFSPGPLLSPPLSSPLLPCPSPGVSGSGASASRWSVAPPPPPPYFAPSLRFPIRRPVARSLLRHVPLRLPLCLRRSSLSGGQGRGGGRVGSAGETIQTACERTQGKQAMQGCLIGRISALDVLLPPLLCT